jgi:peroxiredoxin
MTRAFTIGVLLAAGVMAAAPAGMGHATGPKSKFNRVLAIGDDAPEVDALLGTDNKRHSPAEFKEARLVVVVFMRELCPTTRVYEKRLLRFASDYAERGVRVIAISPSRNPAEGLDKMKARARDSEYPFPYVLDETKLSARQYGATVTPQFFVLDSDRKVRYMGAFDDNFTPEKVERRFLEEAVDALLEGNEPPASDTLPRGCEIEFENGT